MKSRSHCRVGQFEWETEASHPEELQRIVRWKVLMGSAGSDWPGVPQKDVSMGVLELDAAGYYPGHAHPAPEIYFILSGTAEGTVGEETFMAEPGMAISHAPNVMHRMVNKGTAPLRALWFWWAPDGRNDVLQGEVRLLEPMPGASPKS